MMIVALSILISVMLTWGLLSLGDNDTNPMPVPPGSTQTPKPSQPPTQTPQKGVIAAQAFILNSLAGKYKIGQTVEVSAIYEGITDGNGGSIFFFFGPKTEELYIVASVYNGSRDVSNFARLTKGVTVLIRGRYYGIQEAGYKKRGVILDDPEIIK